MSVRLKVLVLICVCVQVACTITPEPHATTVKPTPWLQQFDDRTMPCHSFQRSYSNIGEKLSKASLAHPRAFLSEIMFSRLQGGKLPDSVKLNVDDRTGKMTVTMVGETIRELEFEVSCDEGWFVLTRSRTGNYLGDGVFEEKYRQVSYFREGDSGELILRTVIAAEFSSALARNSVVHAENWYRFQTH